MFLYCLEQALGKEKLEIHRQQVSNPGLVLQRGVKELMSRTMASVLDLRAIYLNYLLYFFEMFLLNYYSGSTKAEREGS